MAVRELTMKPDHHKQKHGKSKRGRGGLKGGRGRGRGEEEDRSRDMGSKNRNPPGAAEAAAESGHKSSDEEEQTSQQYRRRKVVSNWDRYEEVYVDPRDPSQVEPLRGADFSELLAAAGDALSQFRFQDEADWEMEDEVDDITQVDCHDLTESLLCLPLHVRLGVQEVVPEDLAKLYKDDAATRSAVYKPKSHSSMTTVKADDLDIDPGFSEGALEHVNSIADAGQRPARDKTSGQAKQPCAEMKTKTNPSVQNVPTTETVSDTGKPAITTEVDKNNVIDGDNVTLVKEKKQTEQSAIGTKKPSSNANANEVKTSAVALGSSQVQETRANMEDELDMLLAMDTPHQISKKTGNVSSTKKEVTEMPVPTANKVKEEAKTENLEDWLDSVLE